jgi:predicted RNA methylase
MANGTLANLSTSAFIRTPPLFAEWIVHHLFTFPAGEAVTVLDPTSGEGDLLAPCLSISTARLYGVEISSDRADIARQRLPLATIFTSAFEGTSCTPGSMSLILTNPPYFFSNGKRAECRIIADAGELLMPGGIMMAIIPARSAWDGTMISHWSKWYDQVRVWKFPDRTSGGEEGGFEDFTQICVAGVRLATPRIPDAAQKKHLSGFRWRKPEKVGQSPWEQGFPPPDLPNEPLPVPYVVPTAHIQPTLVIKHADHDTLLQAVAKYGAHLTPAWQAATIWSEEVSSTHLPCRPPGRRTWQLISSPGCSTGRSCVGQMARHISLPRSSPRNGSQLRSTRRNGRNSANAA